MSSLNGDTVDEPFQFEGGIIDRLHPAFQVGVVSLFESLTAVQGRNEDGGLTYFFFSGGLGTFVSLELSNLLKTVLV